eukprot:TRINITY_DN12257_c0_g2_i2.p1 TRINITY_DN12257_c0_g2~~TRINITY_DN12257_c0_g2_i2.p1  ORF type:complete len:549 (+),score=62.63 TRINITY_DN12257_c0_g2_i2:61-1647(+)
MLSIGVAEWQLGLLASGVGCFSGTVGVQLRILALTLDGNTSMACHIAGWILWLSGEGFKQLSIGLAPATLITCFSFSAAMLFNTLLAPIVLREKLTLLHGAGVALLCAGGTLVSVVASHGDQNYSWSDLCAYAHSKAFLLTLAVVLSLAATLISRVVRNADIDVWTFAFLFSLSGAFDLLVTKLVFQLVRLHIVNASDDDSAGPFVALPLGVCLLILMHVVVFGFQLQSTSFGDALQNVPLFLGSGVMMQVIVCGAFFDEFEQSRRVIGFVGAFVCMLGGLYIISQAPKFASDSEAGAQLLPSGDLSPSPVDSSASLGRRMTGVISSGALGNQMQQQKSFSDLLLVRDLQLSAVGFSEGPASQAAMTAMRSTAGMADAVVPSHMTHTLSGWLKPGPLRRDGPAASPSNTPQSTPRELVSSIRTGDRDLLVIQTIPSDCSLYDNVKADPTHNSTLNGVLVRELTLTENDVREARLEVNESECSTHNRSSPPLTSSTENVGEERSLVREDGEWRSTKKLTVRWAIGDDGI